MKVSSDGFAAASESFTPRVNALAGKLGYAGAIEKLSRKSEPKGTEPAAYKAAIRTIKRIRKHSAKWSREQREWNKVVKLAIERNDGWCAVLLPKICTGRATTGHHKLHRSQGGESTAGNCLVCCWACHSYIETNPAWAVEKGYTIQRKA